MILSFIVAVVLALAGTLAAAQADPNALWKIVHDHCVPNEEQHGEPAPCTLVDLHRGVASGFVLLKDIRGNTQYLVLPTARITGIEDPKLLAPDAANYFADAWAERGYTERAAAGGHALPRDALSLAVNSPYSRSQNQLHIHIDCLRPDVRAALRRQAAVIAHWAPLAEPLLGHHYWAMRLLGSELRTDPFRLLATRTHGDMKDETVVVVGAEFGGTPGFILLADKRDPASGDRAGGEELQDHTCALAGQ
jgi:CDP-diacylglycerol pyrophosphatase